MRGLEANINHYFTLLIANAVDDSLLPVVLLSEAAHLVRAVDCHSNLPNKKLLTAIFYTKLAQRIIPRTVLFQWHHTPDHCEGYIVVHRAQPCVRPDQLTQGLHLRLYPEGMPRAL